MKSKYTVHYSLLFVVLAHAAALGAALYAPESKAPVVIEPPTIQGVIVASEPITKPPEPTPPPPEPKPQPTPKTPLPKGPVSERAIKQETQVEPSPPVDHPVKEAEPAPAAVVPPSEASELNNPRPPYPPMSNRLREQGTVILEVYVKADGSLGDIRVKTSSGYPRLDDAALRGVKKWRFIPAKRDGQAIDLWYEQPIEFSLNK